MGPTQKTVKKQKKATISITDLQAPIKASKHAEESESESEEENAQEPVVGDSESGSEDGSDDEEDIDEEGMEKLMAALGEDGLDEFAQAELKALAGGSGDEQSEADSDEEVSSGPEELGSEEVFDIEDEREEEDEETQEDLPLDEVESVDEDVVLKQKVEIDNKIALERIRETIKLDVSMPWTETLAVTYPQNIEVDVDDDLNRELAFYKQALHAATTAKSLASKHNLPFTRPSDYFAEMVKSDAHMERIRQRLLDEGASIKRSEEKRKEREGKKFGKQIQMEKLKERERSKKDLEERLKGLKRKRKGALDNPEEDDGTFDVAIEDAISDRPSKRTRGAPPGKRGLSRQARDSKFGFGSAQGRRSKQNTKASTDNFEPRGSGNFRGGRGGSRGGARGGARGGSKRPGKNRRIAARGRS